MIVLMNIQTFWQCFSHLLTMFFTPIDDVFHTYRQFFHTYQWCLWHMVTGIMQAADHITIYIWGLWHMVTDIDELKTMSSTFVASGDWHHMSCTFYLKQLSWWPCQSKMLWFCVLTAKKITKKLISLRFVGQFQKCFQFWTPHEPL